MKRALILAFMLLENIATQVANSAEILQVVPIPKPESSVAGVVFSEDKVCAIEFSHGAKASTLKYRVRGETFDYELPDWVGIRSIVFDDDNVWFLVCYENNGVSWVVAIANFSISEKVPKMTFFGDSFDVFKIRRLKHVKNHVITGVGGGGLGKWVEFRFKKGELNEMKWKDIEKTKAEKHAKLAAP